MLPASLGTGTGAKITKAEYFIDTDPGVGLGVAITTGAASDSINTLVTIPASAALGQGSHRIVTRFLDAAGNWGLVNSSYFFIVPGSLSVSASGPIVAAEFFINKNDPGVGKGIAIPIGGQTDSLNQIFPLNISSSLLSAPRDTITIRVKDASGKWSLQRSDTIKVQGCTPISVANFSTTGNLCANQIITFTNTSTNVPIGGTYEWDLDGNGTIDKTGLGPHTFTYTTSGTKNAILSINEGTCVAKKQSLITIPNFTASIAASGPVTFCPGGSVTLTAGAGAQFLWAPGGQTSQAITVNASGTYAVQITNASGCKDTASQVVTVTNQLGASITASGPTTFCQGGLVNLTASNGLSYAWAPGGQTTQAVSATASGTYIVTISYAGGCTATAQRIVVVNTNPVAIITPSGPTTFCSGQSVTLTASAGTSYQWTPGGQTSQVITASQTGTYTVNIFNAQGCFATASQIITVTNSIPVIISASGPTTFCNGDSVVLTASGATNYVWITGGQITASIKVKTAGTYTVSGTAAGGCTGLASQLVTVTTPSAPTVSASGPLGFCGGGSVTLTSSAVTGNQWSTGATTQSIVVSTSGSFSVKRTDGSGCFSGSSAVSTVTVTPSEPIPTVAVSGAITFCFGGNVVLTSSAPNGNTWSNGATTKSITVNSSGNYTVSVGSSGCISTSAGTVVAVTPLTVGTFAAIPPFCAGTIAPTLPLTSANGISGTWSPAIVNNAASGNYVFAPSSGTCIATTTVFVSVTSFVTPLFAGIGPIASGSTPPSLPSVSLNGIAGTWSPATISNTQTNIYSFTPNIGQCGTPTTLTVVVKIYPDIAVQNVTTTATLVAPADIIPLAWNVRNVGSAKAAINWTERVFIQNNLGQNRTLIKESSFSTADSIGLGQSLSRTNNITLPALITVGDQAVFVVELIPGNTLLEAAGTSANNTGIQGTPFTIQKTLTLQVSANQLTEGSGSGISVTVSRSGSVAAAQNFTINLTQASRFSYPTSLTFQAGQVSRIFTLFAVNNTVLEGTISATLSVSATGFLPGSSPITILDDDNPSLTLTGLPDTTGEGVVLNFQVRTNLAPVSPLIVYLTTSNTTRLPVSPSITIPAGQLAATGSITLVQDATPEINQDAAITAGAAGHNSASKTIHITDNDIPGIELVFQTKTVSESQGFFATQATIRRVAGGNPIAFTVSLSANLSNTLIMPSSVPLAANELSKTFNVGVVDNGQVDGDRKVVVAASIYVSSCGCSAPATSAGYFTDTLNVLDNDGPTLTLSTPVLTLAEGQASAALLKITRNTPTGTPMVVNLSSSNTGEATVPVLATIPAGSNFVDVAITTINDNITDGSKQVNLTATSNGFSNGTLWVIVTDINKPDLSIKNVTTSASSVEAKTIFTYGFQIANTGFAHTPSGVRVKGYLSKDEYWDPADSLITNEVIDQPVLSTQPYTVVNAVQTPNLPGQFKLIFKVNPEAEFSELSYDNNTSQAVGLNIIPEYDATALVDSTWFLQGSLITIKGKASRTNGSPAALVPIDVYVITNNGLRRTYSAQTDELGNYLYQFLPIYNEAGSYTVGACFPGFTDNATDDTFDILGVRINNGNLPQFKATLGDTLKGKLPIVNLTGSLIKNASITPTDLPQGAQLEFGTIALLNPQITDSISYKAWGTSATQGFNFVAATLQVVSQKGNIQRQEAFYYCQAQQAFVTASLAQIDVKMSAAVGEKLVQFKLTNFGQGNTGQVKINLPQSNWLSGVSPTTITNLGPGDSATIILRFSALAEIPFEFPIKGNIGIIVANGNNFSIPFSFEKVSKTTGVVAVSVTNQFTYFAAGAPMVAGAKVRISNYYSGQVYGEGTTDSSGMYYILNVPEGLHRITVEKEKHLPYTGTVSTLPGDTVKKSIFINYQAITFSWKVEPTVIQDQYNITLNAVFETNIPMPVVVLDMPKIMPSLQGDEEFAFMATLTNHGLITAKDVKINLPQGDPDYEFILNYTQSDVLALQSIQIPVLMKRRSGAAAFVASRPSFNEISSFLNISPPAIASTVTGPCKDFATVIYWYKCGSDGVWEKGGVAMTFSGRICSGGGGGGIGTGIGGSGGGGIFPLCANCPPPPKTGTYVPPPPVVSEVKNCKECINELAQATLSCLGIDIPPDAKCLANSYASGGGAEEYIACLNKEDQSGLKDGFIEKIPIIGFFYKKLSCLKDIYDAMVSCASSFENNGGRLLLNGNYVGSPENALITGLRDNMAVVKNGYSLKAQWGIEYFGDLTQNNSWYKFYVPIAPYIDSLDQIPSAKQDSILQTMVGYEIPIVQLQNFFVRWNQSIAARDLHILAPNAQYPGIINWLRIKQISDSLVLSHNYAIDRGFPGINGMFHNVSKAVDSLIAPKNQSVCASVTVQFSQTLTMTREAFRGTLDIFNGHPTEKMDSLSINISVTDENGVPSNGVFQINTEKLTNLNDITGTGQINAQQNGLAQFLFIPEVGAAPTVTKVYNFGGSVRYFDPYAKAIVTLPLNAVSLTVNPSPNLMLHYFMQRDILGDDALTKPKIEPSLPAELAVMVENHGYGPAVNMTISSAQPKIIENEKGLAINFKLIGANFQGKPKQLGVTNINFGTVPGLKTRIGQWYFTSSLLGKFVSYEAKVVHANSFGNPDLSLVKGIKLHELTKTIRVYGAQDDTIGDFLANDAPDINNYPDILYLSQGKQTEEVFNATTGSFNKPVGAPSFTNTLTVTSSATGWNFIKLNDPGDNRYTVKSITRGDGQVIPLENAWLTFVTLPTAQDPVYENKFHFIDKFSSAATQNYTVVWATKNANVPKVDSILGTPVGVTSVQVLKARVKFNKAINPLSFDWKDLDLVFQGGANIANSSIAITTIDTATFDLDLSSITTGNGTYKLIVQALDVEDIYGIAGESGLQVIWTQFLTVPVVQAFEGIPENKLAKSFDSVYVVFNLPIDTLSLTSGRFQIKKNGSIQPGIIGISKTDTIHKRFLLTGIGGIMTTDGPYSLVVNLAQIKTKTQVLGVADQAVELILDRTGPLLMSLSKTNIGGLDAQHFPFLNLVFNEALIGFNVAAFKLSRNGGSITIPFDKLSSSDLKTWSVGNLGLLTYPDGDYMLEVNLSNARDILGNAGAGTQQLTWTVNRSISVPITNLKITPDLGFSTTDGISSDLGFAVGFTLGSPASEVQIYQTNLGGESLLATLANQSAGPVSLQVLLQTGGNTGIKVAAIGSSGGAGSATISLFLDQQPLSAKWINAPSATIFKQVDSVYLVFNARLLTPAAVLSSLKFFKDGETLLPPSIVSQAVNDTLYLIRGLRSSTTSPGNYELRVNLAALQKYTSGAKGNTNLSTTWKVEKQNTAPVAIAGADQVITQTGTVSLNASASYDPESDPIIFAWIAPQGVALNNSALAAPSFTISQTDNGKTLTFLVIAKDGAGLFSTDAVNVKVVLDTAGVSFTGLQTEYCISQATATLVGSPSGGQFTGPGITGNIFNPTLAGPGLHSIVYSKNGKSFSKDALVNALIQPAFASIAPLCSGGTAPILVNTSTNGILGSWTPDVVSTAQTGTYVFTPNAGQCAKSYSTEVVVNPTPAQPTITIVGASSFCVGGSVILRAPAGLVYLWSTGATTQSISVLVSGNYTLQTIAGICKSAASTAIVVTVNTPPTKPIITPSGPTVFALGGSVILSAPAGFSYRWNNGATTQSIFVSSSGTFTVQTIANACTSAVSDPVVVTQEGCPDAPVLSVSGSTTLCVGQSLRISSSAAAGNIWSVNGVPNALLTFPALIVNASGSYTARQVIGACTTAASAPVIITVVSTVAPVISAGGPTTLCGGSTVTLTSSRPANNLWSTGETTAAITASTGGTYTLRSVTGGCSSAVSAAVVVTVTALPAPPTITPSGSTVLCPAQNVRLTSSATYGNLWSIGNFTFNALTLNAAGSYSVRQIVGTCTTAASVPVVISLVNPTRAPVISASGSTNLCTGNPTVVLTSSATLGNSWSTGETTRSIAATTAGAYTVRQVGTTCSSLVSAPVNITACLPPATTEAGNEPSLSRKALVVLLYPNPVANGKFTVQSTAGLVRLKLRTITGVLVYDQELSGNTAQLINKLSAGAYLAEIFTQQGTVYKFVNWE